MMLSYNMDKSLIIRKTIKNEDVYELLRKIPAGKVTTYGDLAKALGNPSASRIIGRILGQNPNPVKCLVTSSYVPLQIRRIRVWDCQKERSL